MTLLPGGRVFIASAAIFKDILFHGVMPQRPRTCLISFWRSPDAEVDAPRKKGLQRPELLCNNEWRVAPPRHATRRPLWGIGRLPCSRVVFFRVLTTKR